MICEADGDVRLYTAALDQALETADQPASDLLFTACGGKQKLPSAIAALRPLDVPTAAIADLDVLREESLLSRIAEAFGGDWEDFKADWNVVQAAVSQMAGENPSIGDVQDQLAQALGDDRTARLAENQSRRVREITKSRDGWKQLKNMGGTAALPNGEATQAADRLIQGLKAIGLFVVPVGQLEGWAPGIGDHGPSFVTKALECNEHVTNEPLKAFVTGVAERLNDPPAV